MPAATIARRWDSFNSRHYYALDGLRDDLSILNGCVMAIDGIGKPSEQIGYALAELNAARTVRGLPLIDLPDPRYVTADILLASGRTIRHERQANGSQLATPTTGPDEMTPAEWRDYCAILAARNCRK
jgi:hypothetical protein